MARVHLNELERFSFDFKSMMKYKLENDELSVTISSKGAELSSLWHKASQTEFMWQADPAIWGKHAPFLFPIIGSLKNGEYQHDGNAYKLPRHGFLRDMELNLISQSGSHLEMQLTSTDQTLEVYPFQFDLRISYQLDGCQLVTTFDVRNVGENKMYFNLGTHPAFAIPFEEGERLDTHYLKFEKPETLARHMLTANGLFSGVTEPVLDGTDILQITPTLFDQDALVFKDLKSRSVELKSKSSAKSVRVSFSDFPYLGIWAKPGAPFVCIEPWIGCADHENASGELADKEEIVSLAAGKKYVAKLEVAVEA